MTINESMIREIINNFIEKDPKVDLLVSSEDKNGKIHKRHEAFRGSCVSSLIGDVGGYSSLKALVFYEWKNNEPNLIERIEI